eukprot:5216826-Amphidinium_carterae.1
MDHRLPQGFYKPEGSWKLDLQLLVHPLWENGRLKPSDSRHPLVHPKAPNVQHRTPFINARGDSRYEGADPKAMMTKFAMFLALRHRVHNSLKIIVPSNITGGPREFLKLQIGDVGQRLNIFGISLALRMKSG